MSGLAEVRFKAFSRSMESTAKGAFAISTVPSLAPGDRVHVHASPVSSWCPWLKSPLKATGPVAITVVGLPY